jgi:hypothetical protein
MDFDPATGRFRRKPKLRSLLDWVRDEVTSWWKDLGPAIVYILAAIGVLSLASFWLPWLYHTLR